jgi:hypothetical protein
MHPFLYAWLNLSSYPFKPSDNTCHEKFNQGKTIILQTEHRKSNDLLCGIWWLIFPTRLLTHGHWESCESVTSLLRIWTITHATILYLFMYRQEYLYIISMSSTYLELYSFHQRDCFLIANKLFLWFWQK